MASRSTAVRSAATACGASAGVEPATATVENRERSAPAGLLCPESNALDRSETQPAASRRGIEFGSVPTRVVALCVPPVFDERRPLRRSLRRFPCAGFKQFSFWPGAARRIAPRKACPPP